jgi:hypothetical protein
MVPGLRPFTNKALLVADSERSKLERNNLLRVGKFLMKFYFQVCRAAVLVVGELFVHLKRNMESDLGPKL